MFKLAWSVLTVLVAAAVANAQPLADRVPADAIVYVGWRGGAAPGPEFEGSRLKAVLDASDFGRLVGESFPRLMQRIAAEDPHAGEAAALLAPLGRAAWTYPTAFCFTGVDWKAEGGPKPRLAVLCQAGAEADALLGQVKNALDKMREDQPELPLQAGKSGDVVVVSVGLTPEQFAGKGGLAGEAGFKAALAQVHKSPVLVSYADGERLLRLIDEGVAMGPPSSGQEWAKARDALGLRGIKRFIWTGGFEGRDWGTQAFLEAPAPGGAGGGPRPGLLALLESEPVSDDVLRLIPQTAAMAAAGRADPAKLFRTVREIAGKIDPQAQAQLDRAVASANGIVGLDLQKVLLDALGDQWAFYTDREVAGAGPLGMVLINKLRVPDKAAMSLARLGEFANGLIASQIKDPKVRVEVRAAKAGGLDLHYLAVPFVSPAWAIQDGNLYFGLYPQSVVAAAAKAAAKGPSILDNQAFAAMRQRLGGGKAGSIQFMDLPQTAGEGYQSLLMLSRIYLGFADLFGAETPAAVLPPLAAIRANLTPAAGVSYTDAAGWHLRSLSAFPGSEVLGMQGGFAGAEVVAVPVMIGTLLPALGAARTTANQMKSNSQARGIHQAAIIWANSAHGNLPSDLAPLYHGQYFTLEFLISPFAPTQIPPDFKSWTEEKQSEWIHANASYYLVPGLKDDADSRKIAVIGKLYAGMNGTSVVYNDNHAVWVPVAEAEALFQQQTGQSLRAISGGGPALGGARTRPAPAPR